MLRWMGTLLLPASVTVEDVAMGNFISSRPSILTHSMRVRCGFGDGGG